MNLSIHLKVAGTLMLILAFAHIHFAKRFGWKDELQSVSLLTRQVFNVHCFFIALVLVLCGLLSILCTGPLLDRNPLAKAILSGLVVFWAARLFIQFFVYDSKLWRGDRLNTTMHGLFSVMWTYYTLVYAAALWRQFQ
jgi:hypothetical protein